MRKEDYLLKLKNTLHYNGKCNDYDDKGELVSSLFHDASHMAYIVDEDREDVITLTEKEIRRILASQEIPIGDMFQLNTSHEIAWIYNSEEDIHYFFAK
jgi:hypothetical protein